MADDSNKVHHSDFVVDEIRENPSGRDAHHLGREYVTFKNEGTTALDVSGWTVANEAGDTFEFPEETVVEPGERVTLHSGSQSKMDFYWGSNRPMWRNTGDTVLVRDAEGVTRIRESYKE